MRRTTDEPDVTPTPPRARPDSASASPTVTISRYRVAVTGDAIPPVLRHVHSTPIVAVTLLREVLRGDERELLGAIFLDTAARPISYQASTVEPRAEMAPRELLRAALANVAASMVLFSSRPSESPDPRLTDLELTGVFIDAGRLVGVSIVDHLILGKGGSWMSLWRRGGW